MRLKLLFAISVLPVLSISARGANLSPAIFFTDLVSGPNSGGENVSGYSGAYVTIYGNNFGTSPTVTWNGLNCLRVVPVHGNQVNAWMWYQKIVVQFGSTCTAGTGTLVVTASGQTSVCEDVGNQSNSCRFTVRSGKIYFVSTTGSDNNNGSSAAPWATITHARDTIMAGDIFYVENGMVVSTDDGSGVGAAFSVTTQHGAAGTPMAIVAYPGAAVTIGTISSNIMAIKSGGNSAYNRSYWVFAGFTLRAQVQAINPYTDSNWKFVGNDISCPQGDFATACFESTRWTFSQFLGNNLHDAGKVGASAEYHGLYPSTDSNHLEIGWNTIANIQGCRGIQIHSSPLDGVSGYDQFDVSIHDNVIHDTQCDGIVLATVDPSKGAILVYNNVIYNVGKANTPEGTGTWFCVYSPGYTNNGTAGSGDIEIYNNTMYNCGPNPSPPYGHANGGLGNGGHNNNLHMHARNNIIYNTAPIELYWDVDPGSSDPGAIYGVNNLMYGIGAPPASSVITGTVNSNPQFFSTSAPDFHLSASTSPANGTGSTSTPTPPYDIGGLVRPSPPSIGAYEFAAGTVTSSKPNPPTNLTVLVQ